jgi:hypothetical protein
VNKIQESKALRERERERDCNKKKLNKGERALHKFRGFP